MKKALLFSAFILAFAVTPAFAQNAKTAKTDKAVVAEKNVTQNNQNSNSQVFKLGEISVSVSDDSVSTVGNLNTVTEQEIQAYTDSDTLEKALLLVPGVAISDETKNQKGVIIRGYSQNQLSVMLDGTPTALPYDNSPDLQRYLTGDLSEIQVAKGLSSVLMGPNTLGGVINMVTKKPTKAFEGDITVKAKFDRDMDYSGIMTNVNLGSKQDKYYIQMGGTYKDSDHWDLANGYKPTAYQPKGERLNSSYTDYEFNAKIGLTPNETDEYVLAYNYQHAKTDLPFNVKPSNTPTDDSYTRFPAYDKHNIYLLTNTAIGDTGYIKTKFYYDSFYNRYEERLLNDNGAVNAGMYKFAPDDYNDFDYGAKLETGADLFKNNTTKFAFHYNRDHHQRWDLNSRCHGLNNRCQVKADAFNERNVSETFSTALEDTWHINDKTNLIVGTSWDYFRTVEFTQTLNMGNDARKHQDVLNPMIALNRQYSETGKVYAGVAQKSRLPTQKEMFSSKKGQYEMNPGLKVEKGINYEVGFSDTFADKLKVDAAAYYIKYNDMISNTGVKTWYYNYGSRASNWPANQYNNIGDGHALGGEIALAYQPTDRLKFGLSYSYLLKKLDNPEDPTFRVTNAPKHSLVAYADIEAFEGFRVIPTVRAYSSRLATDANDSSVYVRLGGFVTADLKIAYEPVKDLTFEAGAANIFDADYELKDGYPSEGRNYFVSLTKKF